MQFLQKRNPAIYLDETSQYINDLQRITLLRDKCQDPTEKAEYDNVIHCMLEVVRFMNTIAKKDMAKIETSTPVQLI